MPISNTAGEEVYTLIDDMVGTLLQWGHPGHFIETSLLLWQIADPRNKIDVKEYLVKIINRFELDREYLKILNSNPTAARASATFLKEQSGYNEHVSQKVATMLSLNVNDHY